MRTLAPTGRCAEYEQYARRAIAIGPDDPWPYGALADAELALGRPVESVRESMGASWQRMARDDRDYFEALDRMALATLLGDAREQDRGIHSALRSAEARTEYTVHSIPTLGLTSALVEAGAVDRAATVVEDFFRHASAWTPEQGIDPWSVAFDMKPRFLHVLVRAHRMTERDFVVQRDAWIADWRKRLSPLHARYLWIYGYAVPTETPEEAAEALSALPEYSPLPDFIPSSGARADVGRVMLLGGRVDDAVRILGSAAADCNAMENPWSWVQASLWLGEALEQRADRDGACRAYGNVVARWGALGARSVTAAQANKRIAALRCKGE
jgi:hypothetical protein